MKATRRASIAVTKMSGAGNDFIVVTGDDASELSETVPDWMQRICRRGISVGADGVLVLDRAGGDRVRMRFHNPDGGPAFCGNGSRCAARWAVLNGWCGPSLVLETLVGPVPAEVSDSLVRVSLPAPRDRGELVLDLQSGRLAGRWVDAGVPHFVVCVPSVEQAPLEQWGPQARRHPEFGPDGANVDVVDRVGRGRLRIRTWERGVEGETLSCGSGAVAAALTSRLAGSGPTVELLPQSGVPLTVRLEEGQDALQAAVLIGDARRIFEGRVDGEALWPV